MGTIQNNGILQAGHFNIEVPTAVVLELQAEIYKGMVNFQHHHGYDRRALLVLATRSEGVMGRRCIGQLDQIRPLHHRPIFRLSFHYPTLLPIPSIQSRSQTISHPKRHISVGGRVEIRDCLTSIILINQYK